MTQVTLVSGKHFPSPAGTPILEAARNAQIMLPYGCQTGRCGVCKCKVRSGSTRVLQHETGLTALEAAAGWILSCVRSSESDLVLEVDDLDSIVLPISKTWPCRISQITHLSPDVIQVLLRLPPQADFRFIPGQYINVIGPNSIRRSYSLARAHFSEKVLELHIRAVPGGAMSDYWFHHAKSNDLLRLNGPHGTFFLRETAGMDLIFLATGTGIAPVKAMLESLPDLPADQKPQSVTVFWGGRQPEDFYLNVAAIEGTHAYQEVQSRPSANGCAAKGYVHEVLLASAPDLSHAAVYACGSVAMIQSARERLVQAGFPMARFYADAFVSSGTT